MFVPVYISSSYGLWICGKECTSEVGAVMGSNDGVVVVVVMMMLATGTYLKA